MKSPNGKRHMLRGLEELECRTVPVLGLLGPAREALLGNEMYDGVVPITRSDFGGNPASGSILSTPMYILTAAHVIGKADVNGALELPATAIDFPVEREAGGGPASIHVSIPGGANFLSVPRNPSGLFWDQGKPVKDADIGIIALPDQEELPNPTYGRVMIAPFRKTTWGGNRYDIYTAPLPFDAALPAADRTSLRFNMVGYGETGLTGAVGNSSDRVDRITIPAPIAGEANTFTLKVGVGAEETAPIRQDATPAAIAAALYALPINGSARNGLPNYVVNDLIDGKVTPGVWDIRSVSDRGSSAHGGGVTSITRSDAGAVPTVTNQWAGGFSGGTKRYGENDFDRMQPAGLGFERNDRIIQGDFDDWSNRISVFDTAGIDANNETGTGRGDSGGARASPSR